MGVDRGVEPVCCFRFFPLMAMVVVGGRSARRELPVGLHHSSSPELAQTGAPSADHPRPTLSSDTCYLQRATSMPLFSSPHPAAPSQRNPLRTKTNEPTSGSHRPRPGRSDGKGTFAIDMLRQIRGEGWEEEEEDREARAAEKRQRRAVGRGKTARAGREAGRAPEVIQEEGDENDGTSRQAREPSIRKRIKKEGRLSPGLGSAVSRVGSNEAEAAEEVEVAPLSVHDQFGFGSVSLSSPRQQAANTDLILTWRAQTLGPTSQRSVACVATARAWGHPPPRARI